MYRIFILIGLLVLFSVVACGKVDQAVEAVDKVKTIKGDIEKKTAESSNEIKSKADEMINGTKKDAGSFPSDGKDESSDNGKKGHGEGNKSL